MFIQPRRGGPGGNDVGEVKLLQDIRDQLFPEKITNEGPTKGRYVVFYNSSRRAQGANTWISSVSVPGSHVIIKKLRAAGWWNPHQEDAAID